MVNRDEQYGEAWRKALMQFRKAELVDLFENVCRERDDAKFENIRLRGYLDDACECARCCECSGWVEDCRIMAAKLRKSTD